MKIGLISFRFTSQSMGLHISISVKTDNGNYHQEYMSFGLIDDPEEIQRDCKLLLEEALHVLSLPKKNHESEPNI